MLSSLVMTIVSTTIIGGIVFIIFNLIFNHNFDGEEQQETDDSVTNQFIDNRPQETDECLAAVQNESKTEPETEEVIECSQPLDAKKSMELSSDIFLDNVLITKTLDQSIRQTDDNNQNEDLLDFEEVIKEANELTDEVVPKDQIQTTDNDFDVDSDKHVINEQLVIDKDVSDESIERQDVEDLKNQFWNIEETPNLKHLNKSRPKKQKSRPSVKVVFTEQSTDDKSDQQIREDPISENAKELVDILFENLDSDLEEHKNRTDSTENSFKDEEVSEQKTFESEVCETNETTVSKNDDTFEEIASGEYKKFDEFSDSFRTETRKHEISRKVYEISSVKNFEITVDTSEPLNEEMFDNLMKSFEAKDSKTEVFEENYRKVRETETMFLRKGDQTTEVVPIRDNESVSQTKTFSERSLSSSSLSKMSLEDLNLSLRSSKSRLSETIDSVTKPLLSSPTLFRRSMVASDEELSPDSGANDGPNRIHLPNFSRSQSSIMKEMKEKEFRKSLKPFNDFKVSDKNISNE